MHYIFQCCIIYVLLYYIETTMSNPILLPANFATYNFALMAKREKNPRNRIRLLAMANIQDGKTLKQVSELLKVHWNTIQTWLRNFPSYLTLNSILITQHAD